MNSNKLRSFGDALEKYLSCTFDYPSTEPRIGTSQDGEVRSPEGQDISFSLLMTDTHQLAVTVILTEIRVKGVTYMVLNSKELSRSYQLKDNELESHARLLGTRDKRHVQHFAKRIEQEVLRLVRILIDRKIRNAREAARGLTREQLMQQQITKQFPELTPDKIEAVVKVATLYAKNNKQAKELAEEIVSLL